VQRTKFELIDALPADGIAILNDDFEYIANRPVGNAAQVFRYGSNRVAAQSASHPQEGTGGEPAGNNGAIPDFRVTDVKYGRGETTFTITDAQGTKTEPFTTRLAGIHNLSNILAGYIAGRALGMTEPEMRHAIASIEQVEHRLDIKRGAGGVTIIDDAFNSNPHGAAMALEVLAGFGETGNGSDAPRTGRRIVVTPGMIELGPKQHELNRAFGRQIAAAADIAVIVGEYNREAIAAGLAEAGFDPGKTIAVRTFDEASAHMRGIVRPGDTILYENDLPDTFK
jgi:UDP-N-acetylmuramoyl-tripeptide--D-alanyl-D-alanine ligase